MEDKKYKWVPWQRYVFILNIDGRYRRFEGISKKANDLNFYKGYKARVIDTKVGKHMVMGKR